MDSRHYGLFLAQLKAAQVALQIGSVQLVRRLFRHFVPHQDLMPVIGLFLDVKSERYHLV